MNADELIEGIGKSVAATKPAQEYCFLWVDHWSMCMTKSEWSGWVQAIGVGVALALPWISYRRKISKFKSILSVARSNVFNWNQKISEISADMGYGIDDPEKLYKAFDFSIEKKTEFVDFSDEEYEAFHHLSTYHSALLRRCVQDKSRLMIMLESREKTVELAQDVKRAADSLVQQLEMINRGINIHTYSWKLDVLNFFLNRPYTAWCNFLIKRGTKDFIK